MPVTESEEITSYDEANDKIIDRFDEGDTGSAVEDKEPRPDEAPQEPEPKPEPESKEAPEAEPAPDVEPDPGGQWSFRGEQIEEQDAQELMEYGVRYIQLLQQQRQEEQTRARAPQQQPEAPQAKKPEESLDPVSRLELTQLRSEWQQERETQRQKEESAQVETRKNEIIQDVRSELEKDEFFKQIPVENKELRAQLEGIALLQLYNASRAGKRVGTKDAVAQAVGALKSFVSSSSAKFLQGAVSQSKNPQPGAGGTPPAQKPRQWTAEDAFTPGHTDFVDHLVETYKSKF
jgi:hypothetical protein